MIDASGFDAKKLEETLTKHMCQPKTKTILGTLIDIVAAIGMSVLLLVLFFLAIAALR